MIDHIWAIRKISIVLNDLIVQNLSSNQNEMRLDSITVTSLTNTQILELKNYRRTKWKNKVYSIKCK